MFEKTFLPFIESQTLEGLRDPMDQCMQNYFKQVKEVKRFDFESHFNPLFHKKHR